MGYPSTTTEDLLTHHHKQPAPTTASMELISRIRQSTLPPPEREQGHPTIKHIIIRPPLEPKADDDPAVLETSQEQDYSRYPARDGNY